MKRISPFLAILPFVIAASATAYEQTHWSTNAMHISQPATDSPMDSPMGAPEAPMAELHADGDPLAPYATPSTGCCGDCGACGCGECCDGCQHPAARLWDNFCFWKHHNLFKQQCRSRVDCCTDTCVCPSCETCEPACDCGVMECECGAAPECGCCETCCDPCQPCGKKSLFSWLRIRGRACKGCVPVRSYGSYAYGQPCGCPGGYPGCGCVPRECLPRHAALGFLHSFDWIADLDWWRETHLLHHPHVRWHCGYGRYAFPYGCNSCGGCGGCGCCAGGDPHAWINGADAMSEMPEGEVTPADAPGADEAPAPPAADAVQNPESPIGQSAQRSILPINFRLFPISQNR